MVGKIGTSESLTSLGYEKAASKNWIWAGDRRHADARQFSTTRLMLLDFGIVMTLGREVHQFRATWAGVFCTWVATISRDRILGLDGNCDGVARWPSSNGV
jgi:hypothetical protein